MKKTLNLRPRHAAGSALLLVLALAGCSKPTAWDKIQPVAGSVTYKGLPIDGANLVFYPKDKSFPDSIRPTATTGAGGGFQVGTKGSNDGAPPGEYDVTITWNPLAGDSRGPNRLPDKYSKPGQLTARVEADGETVLPPFELTP